MKRSLLRSSRGAIALTTAQMFIGAVSLGIGMFRGTEVNAAFHHETTLSHADYGASKLAADHARSANVVVNNNVTMGAIMGPRFGVEADNITMDANAAIACPTCPNSPTCKVCLQYKATKPRAKQKRVDADQKRYELGTTTIFFVLASQNDLAVAAGQLVREQVNYRRNLLQLYQGTGQLLDERGIAVR